jgi:hypothetical protein
MDARMRGMSSAHVDRSEQHTQFADPVIAEHPMAEEPGDAPDQLFIIRAPGIDEQELLGRIRASAARRAPLPHAAAAIDRARMQAERQTLLALVQELRRSVRDVGLVASRRTGWMAALELLAKRCARKLVARHFLQQQRVNLKLLKVCDRLISYLEDHDLSMRWCLDHGERQHQAVMTSHEAPVQEEKSAVHLLPR